VGDDPDVVSVPARPTAMDAAPASLCEGWGGPDLRETPAVTVLMPVHNAVEFVAAAVASILAQTYTNFELLILNDGSDDGSGAVLRALAATDARIRLVETDHLGLIGALNIGLKLARGALLARMDADDVSLPDRLALQVERMRFEPSLFAIGGQVHTIGRHGEDVGQPPRLPVGVAAVRAAIREMSRCPLTQGAALIRTERLRELGGFRRQFPHAEDLDMWLRAANTMALDNLPDTVLLYRWHGTNVSALKRADQIVSTWKAWTCASLRHHLGTDAALVDREFDLTTLASLGLPRVEIRRIARRYLLDRIGDVYMRSPDEAVQTFSEATAMVREGLVSTDLEAQLRFRIGLGYARHRRPLAALRYLTAALQVHPAVAAWAVTHGVRSWTPRLRRLLSRTPLRHDPRGSPLTSVLRRCAEDVGPVLPPEPQQDTDRWDVDVILPTFDRRHSLLRALDSIRRQSVRPARVIVVDDASTDGTADALAEYDLPGLDVVSQATRSGVGAARNVGIERSSAEWLAFLDSDDVWCRAHLATLRSLVNHTDYVAGFASSNVVFPSGETSTVGMAVGPGAEPLGALLAANRYTMIAAVVRRSAARAVGGFSTTMETFEDWDFLLRIADHGGLTATDLVTSIATASSDGVNAPHAARRLAAMNEMLCRFEHLYRRHPRSEARVRCWCAQVAVRLGSFGEARDHAKKAFMRAPSIHASAHFVLTRFPHVFRLLLSFRDRRRGERWQGE
jgi:glycosyltransferase involved in cell wall biosynthesis